MISAASLGESGRSEEGTLYGVSLSEIERQLGLSTRSLGSRCYRSIVRSSTAIGPWARKGRSLFRELRAKNELDEGQAVSAVHKTEAMPPSVFVSSSVQSSKLTATLQDFGYATFSGNHESIRGAFALITQDVTEPRHMLELCTARDAGVAIIVVKGGRIEGSDLVAFLRDQHTTIHDGGGDGNSVVAALQAILRPGASSALRRLTEVVEEALRDPRKPEPESPLHACMRSAPSVAVAAHHQQNIAHQRLRKGRGASSAWRFITTHADHKYKHKLETPGQLASGGSATHRAI